MGNYKSRPQGSCAEEFRKKVRHTLQECATLFNLVEIVCFQYWILFSLFYVNKCGYSNWAHLYHWAL